MAPAEALTEQIVDEKPDRYLIAIGQRIEPRIYKTQSEAESAAETLAYRTGHEIGIYRQSDAGLVSRWRAASGFAKLVVLDRDREAFRPDGSSWLDKPAEGK